jgi:hypothetical protein
VPVSNRAYLEAVLGKDTTSKRDDAVNRASAESSRWGRWRLFGIFGRNTNDAKNAASNKSNNDASNDAADSSATDDRGNTPAKIVDSESDMLERAKKGDRRTGDPSAKKDDAIQKADADDDAPARP